MLDLLLLRLRVPDHLLEVRVLLGQLLHHVLQPLADLTLGGQDPLPPAAVALTVLKGNRDQLYSNNGNISRDLCPCHYIYLSQFGKFLLKNAVRICLP